MPNQPMSQEDIEALGGIFAALFGVAGCVVLIIGIAILIVIILLLSGALKRIPQQHRRMEPAMVWLLLIPLVNIVWMFFVVLKVSKSFQSHFEAEGRTEVGDCGQAIGLAYCICTVAGIIPYLGCLVSVPGLVLLIIYLVKINNLKNMISEPAAQE